MSEPAGASNLNNLQPALARCPFCGIYHEPEDCRATVERLYEPEDAAPAPAIPFGQNTIWPHDLPERVISLEAEVAALRERLNQGDTVAALSHDWGYGAEQRVNEMLERLERIEARLLLPGVPSEP